MAHKIFDSAPRVRQKRQMKIVLALLPLIGLLSYRASFAQEPQNSWLLGRWDGSIQRYSRRSGPARTLRVRSIAPDGTIDALWSVTGKDEFPCSVKVNGSEVTIVIGVSESSAHLTRQEDEVLAGKFTLKSGEEFPIKLMRMERPPK